MKKILILSMVVLLQACANLGQQYEPVKQPIEESVVYFYRPSRFIGRAIPFDIKENGRIKGTRVLYREEEELEKVELEAAMTASKIKELMYLFSMHSA